MLPRCQLIPLPDDQVSFQIEGQERLRWHSGAKYPRPFFFPLVGPSGKTLTRMGHPGAPDHDHHRSIWFAHNKVLGIDFWGDKTDARIRQLGWQCYQDGDAEAVMAVRLGWFDGHDPRELLEQELIAAVRPVPDGETLVELQSTFRPVAETLELGQTNFGFLAERVARSLSVHFGGGTLTNSEGQVGEPAIFARPAKWMDYSGPIADGVIEGITYFDHPSNPGHPVSWHVREDGWMGSAPCLRNPIVIERRQPLRLRSLLLAHRGALDADRAKKEFATFASLSAYEVVKGTRKHIQFEVRRTGQ